MTEKIKEKIGTIVLVMEKTKPEYSQKEVIKLSEAIDPMVDTFNGYLGRKMAFSNNQPDLLMDLVYYTNVKAFEDASEIEMKSETCLRFFNTMIPNPETSKMLITSPLIITTPKQGKVKGIELVLFKTKTGFTKEEVVNAAKNINPVLEKYEGYISRKLSITEDGQWMDVIYWTNLENAEKASKHILDNKLAQKYFEMIDNTTMEFNHFNVVIDTER
ncbi:hypothetical protein [Flavivirga rizhaonensis]|uniref:ABM domain-containing protein n=1 Tax=Flavivirga rizhaonensis TaxID=2559571 RepID=A0A4S1E0P0_9FLAO|nr:hypothetical protein [Flavivirga rizhaonensis]TGV04070.1 hypothetical protein EM932_04545 [Flavivirga rizhaonensis]